MRPPLEDVAREDRGHVDWGLYTSLLLKDDEGKHNNKQINQKTIFFSLLDRIFDHWKWLIYSADLLQHLYSTNSCKAFNHGDSAEILKTLMLQMLRKDLRNLVKKIISNVTFSSSFFCPVIALLYFASF